MKEIVIEVIQEYDLDFNVGFMGHNTGRLTVNMQ